MASQIADSKEIDSHDAVTILGSCTNLVTALRPVGSLELRALLALQVWSSISTYTVFKKIPC